MPRGGYPTGAKPIQKHDLVVAIPSSTSADGMHLLVDSAWGVKDTRGLFAVVEQVQRRSDSTTVTLVVMTYEDALPPVSHSLLVVGFADANVKMVRELLSVSARLSEEDEYAAVDALPHCWQSYTIAVPRGDGVHASKLERYHIANSPKFAKFMKRLRRENAVAILAPDKVKRFGILIPVSRSGIIDASEAYTKDDFCATLYLGTIGAVKEYLTGGSHREAPAVVPTTMGVDAEQPVWLPPEEEDNGVGLWQPPGAEDSQDFGGGGLDDSVWKPSQEATSGRKRSRSETEEVNENTFHADAGAAAADAFYSGLTRSLDTRADSRIFHMRAFNGWVKATQIQECNPRTKTNNGKGLRVLDLACGKGGDLGKWAHHKRGMQNYVGVDVARGSLKDAAVRVRKMRKRLTRCTFSCADLGHDVPGRLRSPRHTKMQKLLTWSLQRESEYATSDPVFTHVPGGGISKEDKFDVISVQFAIHYMMQTRQRARRFFQTASELLEIGGDLICTTIDARVVLERLMDQGLDLHFSNDTTLKKAEVTAGNGACRIQFEGETVRRIFTTLAKPRTFDCEDMFGLEYTFTLVEGKDHGAGVGDAVNLPEWLTPIPMLEAVANDAGLELVSAENFHEFFHNRKDPSLNATAHEAISNMKVLNRNGSIFADNWDISRMYCAASFRKVRESTMVLDDDGVEDEADEVDHPTTQESNKPTFDPIQEKKMLPMAMMKAKKHVGADKWQKLSSDEKKRLTQVELESMMNPEW
jgi:SAM-dependent methyltransferase